MPIGSGPNNVTESFNTIFFVYYEDPEPDALIPLVDAIVTSTQLYPLLFNSNSDSKLSSTQMRIKHIHILILIHIFAQHMDEASFI